MLNGEAAKEIEWHCKHYVGRGLMKRFESGQDFAKDMGIKPEVLQKTCQSKPTVCHMPRFSLTFLFLPRFSRQIQRHCRGKGQGPLRQEGSPALNLTSSVHVLT